MKARPIMKRALVTTVQITAQVPCERRTSPRSPISFMARDCSTSPKVEVDDDGSDAAPYRDVVHASSPGSATSPMAPTGP